jgi:hypothetical protein
MYRSVAYYVFREPQVLDRLLVKLHARGHRVVLFSQFSAMIDLLDDYCTLRGWNFVRLTGSTNRVQRMVNLQVFVGWNATAEGGDGVGGRGGR